MGLQVSKPSVSSGTHLMASSEVHSILLMGLDMGKMTGLWSLQTSFIARRTFIRRVKGEDDVVRMRK